MREGSHDITTPFPITVERRADGWRLPRRDRPGALLRLRSRDIQRGEHRLRANLDEARRIAVNVAKLRSLGSK